MRSTPAVPATHDTSSARTGVRRGLVTALSSPSWARARVPRRSRHPVAAGRSGCCRSGRRARRVQPQRLQRAGRRTPAGRLPTGRAGRPGVRLDGGDERSEMQPRIPDQVEGDIQYYTYRGVLARDFPTDPRLGSSSCSGTTTRDSGSPPVAVEVREGRLHAGRPRARSPGPRARPRRRPSRPHNADRVLPGPGARHRRRLARRPVTSSRATARRAGRCSTAATT